MQKTLRVVVIGRDRVSRHRLVRALRGEPDVAIAGLCADNSSAIDIINRQHPDVIFLDAETHETDGLQQLVELQGTTKPQIVFVTGTIEHAVRALEAGAIEFVLKPLKPERFRRALDRVRTHLQGPRRRSRITKRLLLKSDGRMVFVRTVDIESVESAGNYVQVSAGKDVHLIRMTLGAIMASLDPERFVQIHRGGVVNLDSILEIVPGDHEVVLRNGRRLKLSKRYLRVIEQHNWPEQMP